MTCLLQPFLLLTGFDYDEPGGFSGNGIAVSKDGILKEGQAAFETLTGEKIILKKGDALNISVQIRGKPLWFINNGMKNINHR